MYWKNRCCCRYRLSSGLRCSWDGCCFCPGIRADQLTVAYLPSLADTLRAAGKHINGFFDGATAELAGDHLTISLAHGGYEWLERENCARVISEILEQEFGRQITVEFTGVLDLESNQEIYRKTMEAAEAAIPKAPPRPAAPAPSRPAPAQNGGNGGWNGGGNGNGGWNRSGGGRRSDSRRWTSQGGAIGLMPRGGPSRRTK